MTSTISEDALRGQQSRIMKAMRDAQPQPGSDLRDIASALTSQNTGGPNYFDAMRGYQQQRAKTNIDAEMGVYNQMKEQVSRGDAEAKAVDDAIIEIAGSDPKIYTSLLQDLHNDPENVNSRNARSKVMKYAADRGIVPLSLQESRAKLTKTQRENSGVGGATGELMNRIKASNPGWTDTDALYFIQTGARKGTKIENGNIVPMSGSLETTEANKKAEGRGKKSGEIEADMSGELKKKGVQANNVVDLIKEARSVLPKSSSGMVQAFGTGVKKGFGVSTDASKADAKLKVIGAALTSNVPRFEGPQGVLDVELYKQAAADVANTDLPSADRLSALDAMETLQKKYTSSNATQENQSPPNRLKYNPATGEFE